MSALINSMQLGALRAYQGQVERCARLTHAEKRLIAAQALERTHAILAPEEMALMRLVAVQGRTLEGVARDARRTVTDLAALLLGALDKLVAHYEAAGVQEQVH